MPIPYPHQGIWRKLARAPIWLYRWRLGWLLGKRFLLLEHRGRKSGRTYHTVVEVVHHDPSTDTYYVVSGFGKRADWFRNIQVHPDVFITVGQRRMPALARVLPVDEGTRVLSAFMKRHPKEIEMLGRMFGYPPIRSEEDVRNFVAEHPVVAFTVKRE